MSKERDEFLLSLVNAESKTLYEYNRDGSGAIYVDEKENAIDSLETALFFLNRDDNLKWKWFVFAIHHSFYSFCISALENGNYELVTEKKRNEDDEFYVKIRDNKPRKSKKVPFFINEFRTSAYRIEWEEVETVPSFEGGKTHTKRIEKLIGFWTALARVQDSYYWMSRFGANAITVSDDEMKGILWFSNQVRNDLMHFVPKGYAIGINSIIETSLIILEKIEFLALVSTSILFSDFKQSTDRIRIALENIIDILGTEQNNLKSS